MGSLEHSVDQVAADTGFSGVVRVDGRDGTQLAKAYGLANRACQTANTVGTQFNIASGGKGLTALTIVSLIEEGRLSLGTTARSVLARDLPLIDDKVTVEELLAHRSGIGDYIDEESGLTMTDYVMPVPVHELATTEQHLRVLDGHRAKFAHGARFGYCNSGFVVLALIAERVSGTPFHELVAERVCQPAGMADTEFLRTDELPGRAAVGYLAGDGLRTNVFHLPVRGSGDGGVYSTAADFHSLWAALFSGRIISNGWVEAMVRPRSQIPSGRRYGLGFWLGQSGPAVELHGFDAGASFSSIHDRHRGITQTVLANTTTGAEPVTRRLEELLTEQ